MLNAEKYKNEILENSNVVSDFSMSKDKHTIKKCLGVCKDCFFHEAGDHCSNVKVKWLLSEYKEPIKLTRFEYEILGHLFKNKQYKFIARERNGYLCACINKPRKYDKAWQSLTCMRSMSLFDDLFQFIQWEDSEPTAIEDVLGNCEVIENE